MGVIATQISRGRVWSEVYSWQTSAGVAEDISSEGPFTAEIRETPDHGSTLITAITIDDSDAANGNLTLSLTAAQTRAITQDVGYFDIVNASDEQMHDDLLQAAIVDRPTDTT